MKSYVDGAVICKDLKYYKYVITPSIGDSESTSGWEVYKDDIWLAPELLGSFTDTYAFEFWLGWDITPPVPGNGSVQIYRRFVSAEIENDKVPREAQITQSEGTKGEIHIKSISSPAVDSYAPIGQYISHSLIISSDMYKDIATHRKITKDEFAEQVMHYTGKSWVYKGLNAYVRDGYKYYFEFKVSVIYEESKTQDFKDYETKINTRTFKILCNSNYNYIEFKKRYAKYCEPNENDYRISLGMEVKT